MRNCENALHVSVCVCVGGGGGCVRACVRAYVRECVRAGVCGCVRACDSLHCKNEIITLTFIHG